MPELGKKYECGECGTRFYDLGKPAPICPKCGADQRYLAAAQTRAEARPPRTVAPAVVEDEVPDEPIADPEEEEAIVPPEDEDAEEEVEEEDEDED